jgi:integrase
MAIRYFIQSKKNPAPIYVRIREGRNIDVKARTKFIINPVEWSEAKEQPKNLKDDSFKSLNESLINFKAELTTHLNKRNGEEINIDWLKNVINPPEQTETKKTIPTNLLDYFDIYIEKKKSEISQGLIKPSTIRLMNSVKKLLERFQGEIGSDMLIKDINNDFRAEFDSYCKKELYAHNTILRRLKLIKTVCRDAEENGVEVSKDLKYFKGRYTEVKSEYLTFGELEKIEQTDFKNADYLDNAKDWLIISCYTGQRVSDFMKFDKSKIRIEKGKHLIEFAQIKTGKIMTLPLHPKVLKILKKRGGDFPRPISDQKYNLYIKEVCKSAGLNAKVSGSRNNPLTNHKESGIYMKWELVSSHIGRRSFASNFFGTIPTSLLTSATGHSTETQFLAYIGKTDTQKAQQLADYF